MACQVEPVDDSSSSTHYYSLFTPGDRVVLQSAWKGDVFNGTVRWVGPIRKANLCDPIPVVGVEIDKKIKLDKHFPDLHLDVTGKNNETLFKVPFHHTRVFLPEQLVVHADDYAVKKQNDIVTQYEVEQAAKELDLSAEEYQYQQVILDKYKPVSELLKGFSTDSKDSVFSQTASQIKSLSLNSAASSSELTVGSMVCVAVEGKDSVAFGVIQWIGSLPGFPDAMAGVELDESLQGCSDGTWDGQRLFQCSSGHGYFTSLESLRQDLRYVDEEDEKDCGYREGEVSRSHYSTGERHSSQEDSIPLLGSSSSGYNSGVYYDDRRRSIEEVRSAYHNEEVDKGGRRGEEWDYNNSHRSGNIRSLREESTVHGNGGEWVNGESRRQEGSIEMTALRPSVVQAKLLELQQQSKPQTASWGKEREEDYRQLQIKFESLEDAYQKANKNLKRKEDEYYDLYQSHERLMEKYQERERKYFQLKQSHDDLVTKYQDREYEYRQLAQSHDKLVTKYEAYESELGESLRTEREEFASVQTAHQRLKERMSFTQNELHSKTNELASLRRRVHAMENNWRISHRDIVLTGNELGRGGWGIIWLGEFRGQRVAVKQMHDIIQGTEYMELLHREINTMSQLRHPNLLQFIGAVLDHPSGNPMIITEVMDTSLRKAYESKELTPDPSCRPVILSIMRDVAVGLNYLHCLPDPIIHRDVSSANVLLESKGPRKWKTKISDFGSANRARAAVTKAPGALVYGAPECFQSVVDSERVQTTKVDVFSYGITLCEILTCRFPEHQVFQEMLIRVQDFDRELYSVIVVCTKRQPHERPDMRLVIKDIDNILKLHNR